MGDVTTALEQAAAGQQPRRTIYDLVESQKAEIERALPAHLSGDRFTRIVLTQLRQNKMLQACEWPSLAAAIMKLASVGLEPDGRNAHLVPYKKECTPIIDYRGYIELARRSGMVADIYAYAVYEADEFSYQFGLHRDIVHRPAAGDRGGLAYVYAVANYTNGGVNFEVLTRDDVLRRRSRSKSAKSDYSPWNTDPEAMWRKSAVRALAPYLPYSPELAEADRIERADDEDADPEMLPEIPTLDAGQEPPADEDAPTE